MAYIVHGGNFVSGELSAAAWSLLPTADLGNLPAFFVNIRGATAGDTSDRERAKRIVVRQASNAQAVEGSDK